MKLAWTTGILSGKKKRDDKEIGDMLKLLQRRIQRTVCRNIAINMQMAAELVFPGEGVVCCLAVFICMSMGNDKYLLFSVINSLQRWEIILKRAKSSNIDGCAKDNTVFIKV